MSGTRAPYGAVATEARERVLREGCLDMRQLAPGTGHNPARENMALALRRSKPAEIVEVFHGVFARADVAASIRGVIARSRRP